MAERAAALIRRLVEAIHARPYAFLFGSLALTGLMAWSASTLTLKSRLEDLLPRSAPSVEAMQVLKERLGSADSLVVTLMTEDFNRVKPVLPEIAAELERHPKIRSAEWHLDVSMIDRNALIIFPTKEQLESYLEDLTETIKTAVKRELRLFDDEAEEKGAEPRQRHTWTWAELERDDALSRLARRFREERGRYREYFYNAAYTTIGLQVFPSGPSSDLRFSREILEDVEAIITKIVTERLGEIGPGKVVSRVDLGGSYRGAIEESKTIKGDLASSALFSLSLLSLLLMVAFRSVRVFFCVMLPLIMGTAWCAGLVALTVGYLNMITAFIFAVLLGLGIDFGIHYYGRFREEMAAGHSPLEAMVITQIQCGKATLNAQLTTTVAFLSLTLADFRGFSQFGGVAAMGVVLCHLAVVVVMPAVAFVFERWAPLKLMGYKVDRDESGGIKRERFPLGGGFGFTLAALCFASIAITPRFIDFEYDFRKLSPKPKEDQGYEKVQYGTTQATAPAVIFAQSPEEARTLYEQLQARLDQADGHHPRIKTFQSLYSLVPTEQEEKRELVAQMCKKLRRKVGLFEGDQREGADELLSHCSPTEISISDLPDWVKSQFTDKTGRVGEFIYVSPRGSVNDGQVALAFRQEMLTLKTPSGEPPVVSGKPMVWAEVLIHMEEDGKIITVAALVAVVLVLIGFERNPRRVALILLPLFTAFGVVQLMMAVWDIKLNFFNMLAAPTLIGLGVDGGAHMVHRYRELGRGSINYVLRHTGWAILLAALTTSIGYASLVNANHRGLNSLGLTTLVAIGAYLFTTFIILPAILQWLEDRSARAEDGQGASQRAA